MKRICVMLLTAALFVGVMSLTAGAAEQNKHVEQSVKLLKEMETKEGVAAFAEALRNSHGVAIFPSVLNVAAGVGGMGGDGIVLAKKDGEWYGPSFARTAGLSIGLQAGVEEIGIICIINDAAGLQKFMEGRNFEFGADASAVAGPWGIDADTAKKKSGDASIYTYTVEKGVFAGLALEGGMMQAIESLNKDFWGADKTPQQALATAADPSVKPLVDELKKLEAK